MQDEAHHHLDAVELDPLAAPGDVLPALAELDAHEHLDAVELDGQGEDEVQDAAADRGELDAAGELAPARGCR